VIATASVRQLVVELVEERRPKPSMLVQPWSQSVDVDDAVTLVFGDLR
jgi:hypothetical protein